MGNFMDKVMARLYTRFPFLLDRWAKRSKIITFQDTFFVEPFVAREELKVALVTTGGVHLKTQEPFDMKDRDGDPSFREIPGNARVDELTVTHDYYDSRDALKDIEVVFPILTLSELAEEGFIREVNWRHFSFMGHIQGPHLEALMNVTAPEVAARLRKDGVGAVLLAPA